MKFDSDQIRKKGRTLLAEAVNLLYPPRCPICDEVLAPGRQICLACRKKVVRMKEPVCKRCGKQLDDMRREYCLDCSRKTQRYQQGKAVFVYQGAIRQSMYRFKYANRREYARFYAREAAELYRKWITGHNIEVIVPVPIYEKKQRRRGYNQAEVFARALGRELDIPVDAGLVRRVRNTTPQKELNDKERKANLKNAFQLSCNIVKYKQILLVDDIYTTGSTMDAVAEVLQSGENTRIYYICISIGSGF